MDFQFQHVASSCFHSRYSVTIHNLYMYVFFKFSTVFNIQMQCICVDPIIGLIAYTCT